jgi:hypothetical protein
MEFLSQVRNVINAKKLDKLLSEHREREVISDNTKNKIHNSEPEVISDKSKSKIPNSEPENVESTPNSKLSKETPNSKIPNSEPENVESTPISNSKFLKVIPNNYEYIQPFFSPNYKFVTSLEINLAGIPPVEESTYDSF